MNAFVEFGHEASIRSPLFPCRIQNLIKNGTLLGLFSFYWPILLQGFDSKSGENVQKLSLEVVPIKCRR